MPRIQDATVAKRYVEPANPVGSVIELFAGVGGFRYALAKTNWKTVFANQWEPSTKSQHAFDCYVGHFESGIHSNEDIASVVAREKSGIAAIPDADLLVGGFPCQDYSVAKTLNSSKGLQGKKGVLWWEIHTLVQLKNPRFIFLENVDRLLKSPSSQRGRDFAIMLRTLGDLGYSIEWRVINAAEAGFPQRRIRVYIVAKRIDGESLSKLTNAHEVLSSTGVFARAFPVQDGFATNTFQIASDPVEISENFGKGQSKSLFESSGYYFEGQVWTATTQLVDSIETTTLGQILLPDDEVPADFWIEAERIPEWEYLKGAKTIERVHKESGFTFKYAEGKMAFPDSLDRPARTIITGEGGTSPSRFKHIIKTERGYRRLTPVELERLNGFPDNWTKFDFRGNPISDVKRAFFMGNALVTGIVETVGGVLAQDLLT